MACWEVVGGGDKGGILVRAGQGTSSEQLPERLSTGAVVEELQLVGERLQYQLRSGEGPKSGWVSISLKDKALLIRKDDAPAKELAEGKDNETAEETEEELREGDYFVTLGPIFKKAGSDPESAKILQLNRKVGAVVHTTGKIWKGPTGGFWVELDVSSGDSGAGEKPGYVMIDASGFGTPGPCLQKAYVEDGAPMILKALRPDGLKAWDGSTNDKEFLAFPKTTGAEIRIVLGMLYGVKAEAVTVKAGDATLEPISAPIGERFKHGDAVSFEVAGGKAMKLVVMSPLELGEKLTDLEVKDDWTVGLGQCQIKMKEGSMLMAKGKMGERVSEDAQLKLTDLVVDYGYKDGDEIGFIYMGDPEADLKAFLERK